MIDIHPVPSFSPQGNDYWKINSCIAHCLKMKVKKFIIASFGEIGLTVKNILNTQFGIDEFLIIDEQKSRFNSTIISPMDFEYSDYLKDSVVILCSKGQKSHELKCILSQRYPAENIICPFEDSLNKNMLGELLPLDNEIIKVINSSNTLHLMFLGDMLLLEDMVKSSKVGKNQYNFNHMFELTKNYLMNADFIVSTLEGPLGTKDYSVSNFNDGKAVKLNFPIEFAQSIKAAGVNLVSICNNHSFDCGWDGFKRTQKYLSEIGLDSIGLSENGSLIKYYQIKGVRIGFISVCYGFNNCTQSEYMRQYYDDTISLCQHNSPHYEKISRRIKTLIEQMKTQCDLVSVISHIGEDYIHVVTDYQKVWTDNFIKWGANIVLSTHAHALKPIEHCNESCIIVNCPGNYCNSYVKYDGDVSVMVEILVDAEKKKILGTHSIPTLSRCLADGKCSPIPINYIVNNSANFTLQEWSRAEVASELSGEILYGVNSPMDIYRFSTGIYEYCSKNYREQLIDYNNTYNLQIFDNKKVCFIGDSITKGSNNGGIPWYEPLIYNNRFIPINHSYGGATLKSISNNLEKIPVADVYFIALGCNDIRYRDPNICCMDADEYRSRMIQLIKYLRKYSAIIFVLTPWPSMAHDKVCKVDLKTKSYLYEKYISSLNEACQNNDAMLVNIYPLLVSHFNECRDNLEYSDFIHPASDGIKFICYNVYQILMDLMIRQK